MGGFGSGGSRTGAGRKKKPTHLRGIDGGADRRGPRPDAGDQDQASSEHPAVEAPSDLQPEERQVWAEWAPLALAERTLTASTLAAFVHLCQMEVDRRELRSRYLRRDAKGELRALLHMDRDEELAVRREHRTLQKDIKAAMKDFKLAPFGKEILSAGESEGDADPLDAFTRKRG